MPQTPKTRAQRTAIAARAKAVISTRGKELAVTNRRIKSLDAQLKGATGGGVRSLRSERAALGRRKTTLDRQVSAARAKPRR